MPIVLWFKQSQKFSWDLSHLWYGLSCRMALGKQTGGSLPFHKGRKRGSGKWSDPTSLAPGQAHGNISLLPLAGKACLPMSCQGHFPILLSLDSAARLWLSRPLSTHLLLMFAALETNNTANINGFWEQVYSNGRRENKRWLTLTIVKGTITALETVVIEAKLLIWAPDWFLEKATHVYTQTFPHKHREREHMITLLNLTYMQSASCRMQGWMKHKLESRLPGEISITSDTLMTPPLWQKEKNYRAFWWNWKRRVKKLS